MKKTFLIFTALCLHLSASFAAESYSTSLIVPVDVSSAKQYTLSVKIPDGYKSIQPISVWNKAELIEFVPAEENMRNWSEIITVNKFIGARVPAQRLTALLKQSLSAQAKISSILDTSSKEKGYQKATFIVRYSYQGNEEILGAQYLSGPYDCSGVQYTIRLKGEQTEKAAVAKINQFFTDNLTVLEN